jgi:protease I
VNENLKVISLIHNEFEDLELWYPVLRLREEGITVHIAGEKANTTYYGKYGVPAVSDLGFSDICCYEYDGLMVPGGWAPDKLRRFPEVLEIVRLMNDKGKPIGQICHAGWVLISAGIIRGKRVTSTPGIKDDMINAGGIWIDEPAVADGNIVSSRKPLDLPEYMKAYIKLLKGE